MAIDIIVGTEGDAVTIAVRGPLDRGLAQVLRVALDEIRRPVLLDLSAARPLDRQVLDLLCTPDGGGWSPRSCG